MESLGYTHLQNIMFVYMKNKLFKNNIYNNFFWYIVKNCSEKNLWYILGLFIANY